MLKKDKLKNKAKLPEELKENSKESGMDWDCFNYIEKFWDLCLKQQVYKQVLYKKAAYDQNFKDEDIQPITALRELLCVNTPNVDHVFFAIQEFLGNIAYIVRLKENVAILSFKRDEIGKQLGDLSQHVLCLYRLPFFEYNRLTFKCFNTYCSFEKYLFIN